MIEQRGPETAEPSAREARKAAREAKRQQKDDAYEQRLARKRAKNDTTYFHGHHVVDAQGLREAFPEEDETEDNPVRFRHRLIHGITLVVLAAMVIAAVVLAGLIARGEVVLPFGKDVPAQAITCPGETFDYPANKTVSVNVYNSTTTEGLASKVAAELKKRGYLVKQVANSRTEYTGTAVVVSGATGQGAAFNLQRNIAGTEYVQDTRSDATVDLFLTGSFTDLIAAKKVDQTPGLLSCPRLNPAPSNQASKAAIPAKK